MDTPTPRIYLSVVGGIKRAWTVIYQGGPLCPPGPEDRARAVYAAARKPSDPAEPPVWDGDLGAFTR